jgi:hypothetical protein
MEVESELVEPVREGIVMRAACGCLLDTLNDFFFGEDIRVFICCSFSSEGTKRGKKKQEIIWNRERFSWHGSPFSPPSITAMETSSTDSARSSVSFYTAGTPLLSPEDSPARHTESEVEPQALAASPGATYRPSGPSALAALPVDVLRYILRFMDAVTLLRGAAKVCRGLGALTRSPSLWIAGWMAVVEADTRRLYRRLPGTEGAAMPQDARSWNWLLPAATHPKGPVLLLPESPGADELQDMIDASASTQVDAARRALFALCTRSALTTAIFTHIVFVADGYNYKKELQDPSAIFLTFCATLQDELLLCMAGEATAREDPEYLRSVALGLAGRPGIGVFFPVVVCLHSMTSELRSFWISQIPNSWRTATAPVVLLYHQQAGSDVDLVTAATRQVELLYREKDLMEYYFLLTHVAFTDIKQYFFPEEMKVALCSSILARSGRTVELRFFLSIMHGSFPRLFFKCIYMEGSMPRPIINSEFERNPTSLNQNLFQGGFGRVEVDIAPVVYGDAVRHIASLLETSPAFPWRLLWNVLVMASGASALLAKHVPALLVYYQLTLTQAFERAMNLQSQS